MANELEWLINNIEMKKAEKRKSLDISSINTSSRQHLLVLSLFAWVLIVGAGGEPDMEAGSYSVRKVC